jgi:hypothetical protein
MRNAGTRRRHIVVLTLVVWFLIVVAWAYLYGRAGLAAAMKAPEDLNWTWGFWLLMFAFLRLPLLVVGLAVALLAEFRFVKGENGAAG